MLASTVQFSRYGRIRIRDHRDTGRRPAVQCRIGPMEEVVSTPSGPNSVPTIVCSDHDPFRLRKELYWTSRSTPTSELVSVPPLSSRRRTYAYETGMDRIGCLK